MRIFLCVYMHSVHVKDRGSYCLSSSVAFPLVFFEVKSLNLEPPLLVWTGWASPRGLPVF